jgi:4-carboxymuconolactone decarboxylase
MSDDRHARGERTRREILGDAHVDAAEARATSFTSPFQEYLTGAAWADVWSRPGLDRRTRSAITLALLTALRAEEEIPMHVRAALRNGLSREEIAEVLLHAAAYAGLPAANAAFRLADEVLREEDAAEG